MKTKRLSKKSLLIVLATTLVVAGGAFALLKTTPDKPVTATTGSDGINYGPATSAEKKEAEQNKKQVEQRVAIQNQAPGNNNSKQRTVQPVIVDANQYNEVIEVSAYVPGVVESGGTCTATLQSGDSRIIRAVPGVADATTTRCPIFSIKRSELPTGGSWKATVSYTSVAAAGTSEPRMFGVK